MTDIGRAGMVMKGNYNSASTYETLDVVRYSNGLYVAKQNVPVGTLPTDTAYWQVAIADIIRVHYVSPSAFNINAKEAYSIDVTDLIPYGCSLMSVVWARGRSVANAILCSPRYENQDGLLIIDLYNWYDYTISVQPELYLFFVVN